MCKLTSEATSSNLWLSAIWCCDSVCNLYWLHGQRGCRSVALILWLIWGLNCLHRCGFSSKLLLLACVDFSVHSVNSLQPDVDTCVAARCNCNKLTYRVDMVNVFWSPPTTEELPALKLLNVSLCSPFNFGFCLVFGNFPWWKQMAERGESELSNLQAVKLQNWQAKKMLKCSKLCVCDHLHDNGKIPVLYKFISQFLEFPFKC